MFFGSDYKQSNTEYYYAYQELLALNQQLQQENENLKEHIEYLNGIIKEQNKKLFYTSNLSQVKKAIETIITALQTLSSKL